MCALGLRGSGYDIPNQALDVIAVLDDAGIDVAHVVASSSGGPVGCALAAFHADRVATLALVGTGPDLRTTLASRPDLLFALEALIEDVNTLGAERAAHQRDREIAISIDPLFMRDEYTARGDGDLYDQRLRTWDERVSSVDLSERARWLAAEVRAVEAYLAWNGLAVAEQITTPTLVLHGSDDRAIPASEGAELARAIPNSRLAVYDGKPHSLLWRHPPALAEVMHFQAKVV